MQTRRTPFLYQQFLCFWERREKVNLTQAVVVWILANGRNHSGLGFERFDWWENHVRLRCDSWMPFGQSRSQTIDTKTGTDWNITFSWTKQDHKIHQPNEEQQRQSDDTASLSQVENSLDYGEIYYYVLASLGTGAGEGREGGTQGRWLFPKTAITPRVVVETLQYLEHIYTADLPRHKPLAMVSVPLSLTARFLSFS